jgi:hypothetical protein
MEYFIYILGSIVLGMGATLLIIYTYYSIKYEFQINIKQLTRELKE